MAMSGSKRRNRAASAQGQEADIAVPALDPRSWGVRKTLVFRIAGQAAIPRIPSKKRAVAHLGTPTPRGARPIPEGDRRVGADAVKF